MTAEERAHAICATMEARMRQMGVYATAHYDAGCDLIAAAIEDAVTEAIARVDWRPCPDCDLSWPHPSETSGMRCPACHAAKAAEGIR